MKLAVLAIVSAFASALHMPISRKANSVVGLTNHILSPFTTSLTIRSNPSYLKMVNESNHDEVESNASITTKKIEGRKKRVILGYKISSVMYAIFGMFIFGLSKKPFYASGPLLASGLSYILIGAAENNVGLNFVSNFFYRNSIFTPFHRILNNILHLIISQRLASDTYKKVNIVMAKYGLFGFAAGILMSLSPAWNLACVITMINSTKGYGYGLKGWELKEVSAKDDLVSMIKDTVTSMTKVGSINSMGYLITSIVMLVVTIGKFLEIMNLVVSKSDGNMIGTRMFRFTKYMLFTLLMTVLKSASDRNRLEGTTFIQMNMMAAIGYGSWVGKYCQPHGFVQFSFYTLFRCLFLMVYHCPLAYLVTEYGKLTQFGALMAACSIFTGANGISSIRQKLKKTE